MEMSGVCILQGEIGRLARWKGGAFSTLETAGLACFISGLACIFDPNNARYLDHL